MTMGLVGDEIFEIGGLVLESSELFQSAVNNNIRKRGPMENNLMFVVAERIRRLFVFFG